MRRAGNKALPNQTGSLKKRDAKAEDKSKDVKAKKEEDETPVKVERNENG